MCFRSVTSNMLQHLPCTVMPSGHHLRGIDDEQASLYGAGISWGNIITRAGIPVAICLLRVWILRFHHIFPDGGFHKLGDPQKLDGL